ncbi:MAG: tetratricopeptide repeat protein [Candidatus Edwardsbacteria bacterium]|jgi:TolA-binding protein|nr:tetratricopeptide repeat protein [Candidatus Edwardsbacteria bacterium]
MPGSATSAGRAARCLAVSSLLVWCGGCAYFNTYYNGQRLYRQARGRAERQFPDTLMAGSGETATYLKAIDKFAVVVRDHPDSRWALRGLYHMGLSYYYTRDYQKAARKFQEIWEYYPDSKFAPLSRLNAAVISWKLGDHDRTATLSIPLRDHRDRQIQERAAYLEALALHSGGNPAEARIAWERFLRRAKGTLASSARLDYARCLLEIGEPDQAVQQLEIVSRQRMRKSLRHQIWTLLGQTYLRTGRDRDAILIFDRILRQQPDNATAAQTEYQLAAAQARSSDAAAALTRYAAVAKKYPSSAASAQCYFDMAALLERDSRPDTALALYRKARSEHPSGPLAEAALRKSSDLALLMSYRQSTPQSRQQGAALQFLMAEHYLFGLGLPDSATTVYQRVAAEYRDLPLAPKALLAAAWSYDRVMGDTAGANPLYRRVVADYPATRYANGARDRLGLPLDPTVADSEPDIEFRPAAAATAADSAATSATPPPVPGKQFPADDGQGKEPIPGPDQQLKQTDDR